MVSIAIGADHGGYNLKEKIKPLVKANWIDVGTDNEESCNYAKYAKEVAKKIQQGEANFGILICKSGIGVSIAANRYKNVYAALCFNKAMVKSARTHNNANVLCLAADYITLEEAIQMIELFLVTEFEAGGRHEFRVNSIDLPN